MEEAVYRALDEPIADVACEELIGQIPGAVAQVETDPVRQDTQVEGELACRYDLIVTAEQGDSTGSLWITVAFAGDDAESAITGMACCGEGDLIEGSDPPRRDSCHSTLCASSFTVEGFVVSAISQGGTEQPLTAQHEVAVDSVERVVASLDQPLPVPPVSPESVLVESCEQTTPELRMEIGAALGAEQAAFSYFYGSGDEFWMGPWAKMRRGTTECAWSLDDPAQGSGAPMAMVTVIPGAVELLERPDSRYVDAEGAPEQSIFYFAVDGAVVKVSGVDRATAEAIAEAHRR